MISEALLLPLSALDRGSLPIAGGKAANLGAMIRAGIPVPDGFVLTTSAFQIAKAAARLGEKLDALATTNAADRARLGSLAAEIRGLFVDAPMPSVIAEAATAAYERDLKGATVAVRSSATAEDLPDASFAGQQDTYLGVLGQTALLDAIRRCWASLFTERAVVYRADRQIDPRQVALAVVVQRLVDVRTAGVLFTANPITGRRREAVIDAAPGLGEAVVSGATNPDHFVVDIATEEILERRVGDKRLVIEADPEGGTRHTTRDHADGRACVTDEEVRALAAMGARVEAHFGSPQDIEWAIDRAGKVHVVQSRPITTLFPIPVGPWSSASDLRVYFSFNVAQGVFGPFTPMGIQFWKAMTGHTAKALGLWDGDPLDGAPLWAIGADRLFLDVTGVFRNPVGRSLFQKATKRMEARTGLAWQSLVKDERLGLVSTSPWLLARSVLVALNRSRAPLSLLRALIDPDAVPGRVEEKVQEALAFAAVPEGASPRVCLDAVERMLRQGCAPFVLTAMPSIGSVLVSMLVMRSALGGLLHEDEVHTLLRSLPHNPTTEMDLDLWRLSSRMRLDPPSVSVIRTEEPSALATRYANKNLPLALQRGLEAFLERWGARGVAEIDLGVPRWSDDPTHLLGSLKNYLSLAPDAISPEESFARAGREADAMAEKLAERATYENPIRGRIARFALRHIRRLMGAREAPKFGLVRIAARMRELLLRAGGALAREGKLKAADDVLYLDLKELRLLLEGQDVSSVVVERRARIMQEKARKHVPRILLSDGTEPHVAIEVVEGSLSGTPASAGQVTGKARVILDPVGARIEHGEILVAPSTDPGWTPLFLTAGGLVMEMGGSMSHGAVVAREYGIAAVVGVADATRVIQTGQTITVDGSAGTVVVERGTGA